MDPGRRVFLGTDIVRNGKRSAEPVTTPTQPGGAPAEPPLSPEERRWLHDKYERLAAEEGQLSSSRTSYYAAIGTVLITGLVVAIADLINEARLLVLIVSFLSLLGILISVVWASLLHRTNDAQSLYREAASQLERDQPPIPGVWRAPITLRSGEKVEVNLLRPFQAHAVRFSSSHQISWVDRLNPSTLTEILPFTFLVIWSAVLVAAWFWWLVLR